MRFIAKAMQIDIYLLYIIVRTGEKYTISHIVALQVIGDKSVLIWTTNNILKVKKQVVNLSKK